jgi:hypothetical protein
MIKTMDIKIAKEIQDAFTAPGVKKAWLSDNKPLRPEDCPNCGGYGYQAVFVTRLRPLKTPAGPYSGLSSKYADGLWWAGSTYTAPCPVCGGDKTPGNKILSPNAGN